MEHKKTMLDYIADCPEFIRNNVADSAALTKPLVDEYVSGGYKNIWRSSPHFILYPARMISARPIWSLSSAKAATA